MKFRIFAKISRFFGGTPYQRSEKKADSVNNTPKTEEYERCVMCGALTSVPISMPVDWRENYEIGLGQICAECAKKERETQTWVNTLTTEQILQAVEQCRKENNK